MARHVLPALATKADLVELKHEMTLCTFVIVGLSNAVLFFALRYLP